MGIDTQEVLKAASTKWNFLPFKPGLPGGHCISIDPYYLAQKAQELGYYPEIILTARRMNDSMAYYVAAEVVKLMILKDLIIKGSKILILGITFKENCPDVRNTKVVDLIKSLTNYGIMVSIYDPWASPIQVLNEYQLNTTKTLPEDTFDAIVLAVSHDEFLTLNLSSMLRNNGVLYDIKGILKEKVDGRL
jgi:UDP-N-acetyl-D-galactosamine dehydrogenase